VLIGLCLCPSSTAWQIVFRNPISAVGAIGSAVGIGGVFIYSLTKAHYDQLAAANSSSAVSSPAKK